MRRVIIKPMTESVVDITNTKEFKTYVMFTRNDAYLLKKCNPVGKSGKKWCWINLFHPGKVIGFFTPTFIDQIQFGVSQFRVFECDHVGDLIDLLQDYEEDLLRD